MKIFFSTGEASGDLYLHHLIKQIKNLNPQAKLFAVSNKALIEEGVELIFDNENFGILGFFEGLKASFRLRENLNEIFEKVRRIRPNIFVPISFSGFNLRLAKRIKSLGTKVVYLAPPQVWAWGQWRLKTLKEVCDQIIALFPFEEKFFKSQGLKAKYFGHPLSEIVKVSFSYEEIKKKYLVEEKDKMIALMPGSRKSMVKRNLPKLLSAYLSVKNHFPRLSCFILGVNKKHYERFNLEIKDVYLTFTDRYELISASDLVLTTSGTASLEVALLNKPFLASYSLSPLSLLAARILVKSEFISLPNIILKEKVFLELVNANPKSIARALFAHLKENKDYTLQFQKIKKELGRDNVLKNIAANILTSA